MKKILGTITCFTLINVCYAQQWSATNLSNLNAFTVTAVESHKSELYSVLFNSISGEVYRLDSEGNSWSQVSITGTDGNIVSKLQDATSRIYLSTNSLGSGALYYSRDDLNTLIADTIGLPRFLKGIVAPIDLQYFNGKILLNLGSSGYWLKDTTATTWHHIDPPTALNGGKDPLCCSKDTLFAHDNSGANLFYVSGDYGQTWSVRNTNLPTFFIGNVLVANRSTGRLYMAGAKTDGSSYGTYYSDDNGFNWTIADLSAFIGKDVNGGQQEVRAIYANSEEVWIALENNNKNTTPDVLTSKTGIQNMAYDTMGLLNDPSGQIYGAKFVEHNGGIAMALNVRDVFMKSMVSGITERPVTQQINAFPNPTHDVVNISENIEFDTLRVFDMNGKVLISSTSKHINLHNLPQGVYLVELINHNELNVQRFRVLKE